MFSVLGSRMEHKKAIENRTAVYFCLHHEFYKFLSIFGHFWCFAVQFPIFLQSFSGIQKYAWKDGIYTVILAIEQKIKHFILRDICKITLCPSLVTLALLLFIMGFYLKTDSVQDKACSPWKEYIFFLDLGKCT